MFQIQNNTEAKIIIVVFLMSIYSTPAYVDSYPHK